MEGESTPSILQVGTTSSICCKVVEEKCNTQSLWLDQIHESLGYKSGVLPTEPQSLPRKLVISVNAMFHRNDHTLSLSVAEYRATALHVISRKYIGYSVNGQPGVVYQKYITLRHKKDNFYILVNCCQFIRMKISYQRRLSCQVNQ